MFVQVIEAKATDPTALKQRMEAWEKEVKPGAIGFLGSTAGVSEDGIFIASARFESEEAARQNSDRPEQSQWWEQTAQYLDDPKFYDCKDVDTWLDGGSDNAGFVQVIQAYANDKEKVREMGSQMNPDDMRKARPDVIGGVVAWGPDDGVSQFVYFTSEEEARKNESRDAESGEEDPMAGLFRDQKFIDLKDPWLTSP